jgi:hypothetical protein
MTVSTEELAMAYHGGWAAPDPAAIAAMHSAYGQTHFQCDGADVIAVADGLVTRKDTYLDLTALTEQVGSLPSR